jgi:RimJ/RimL family protein N-acetyltransferase
MFISQINVDADLKLVKPNSERDGSLSVSWRSGPEGHKTQANMGIAPHDIRDRTLAEEQAIIQSFLDDSDELVWMLEYKGKVVGSIEVALKPTKYLQAPAIHIMIGDPLARGQGIGKRCMSAVITWLQNERHESIIYTRHLIDNQASAHLLRSLGFINNGPMYADEDGLKWQNVKLQKD